MDRYDVVRSKLERETAALLAERRQLQTIYDPKSSAFTPKEIQNNIGTADKTTEVVDRLQQIIRLCKDEGSLSYQEMREVLKVENEVLSFLHRATPLTTERPPFDLRITDPLLTDPRATQRPRNESAYNEGQPEQRSRIKSAYNEGQPEERSRIKSAYNEGQPEERSRIKSAYNEVEPEERSINEPAYNEAQPEQIGAEPQTTGRRLNEISEQQHETVQRLTGSGQQTASRQVSESRATDRQIVNPQSFHQQAQSSQHLNNQNMTSIKQSKVQGFESRLNISQDRSKMGLNQNTLIMIAEIQRKALNEILHLQRDRDQIKLERDQLRLEKEKLSTEAQKVKLKIDKSSKDEVGRQQEQNILREDNNKLKEENTKLKEEQKLFQEKRLREEDKLREDAKIRQQKIREESRIRQQKLREDYRAREDKRILEENKLRQESQVKEDARLREENRLREEHRLKQNKENKLQEQSRLQDQNRLRDSNQLNILPEQSRLQEENKLREDNRLREENRLLKEQNSLLRTRMEALGQLQANLISASRQNAQPTYPASTVSIGQYDPQIVVYENELKRASAIIGELKSKLINVPGIEILHEQGENLRREAADILLRVEGWGNTNNTKIIKELQQKLEEEQLGKDIFLEELKKFKQKYVQLEQECRALKKGSYGAAKSNVPNYQRGPSGPIQVAQSKTHTFGGYEQTLNQMRKALQF